MFDLSDIVQTIAVITGVVFGTVVVGLGLQFANNLSRNMSMTNTSVTQGLKDALKGGA